MPKFRVVNTALAIIKEYWEVDAPDQATAEAVITGSNLPTDGLTFLEETVLGEESNREIVLVEELR